MTLTGVVRTKSIGQGAVIGLMVLNVLAGSLWAWQPTVEQRLREVRAFPVGADPTGANPTAAAVGTPLGVAYSPVGDRFVVLGAGPTGNTLTAVTRFEDQLGSTSLTMGPVDPATLTFDGSAEALCLLDGASAELIQIRLSGVAGLDSPDAWRFGVRHLGLSGPRGMTQDPTSGAVFILEENGQTAPQLLRIDPGPQAGLVETLESGGVTRVTLGSDLAGSVGLGWHPASGRLFTLDPLHDRLVEITLEGQTVATHDLTPFGLRQPRAFVIAPDGDSTNAPAWTSFYILDEAVDGSTRLVELSFVDLAEQALADQAQAAVAGVAPTLIRTVDTSDFNPPSPDPAGITYIPTLGRLLISDSEVNEMPIFGANLFDVTLSGGLQNDSDTLDFSEEPTGVSYHPGNGTVFVSDDDNDMIYEVDPGSDGVWGTNDDSVTSFDTREFNSQDPEGVCYDPDGNQLFVVDGVNREVYRLRPGPNGVFDGVEGDDQLTQWDVGSMGAQDPEGCGYNPVSGTIFVSDTGQDQVLEMTTSGTLVAVIDLSDINPSNAAGVVYAPASDNPSVLNLYIVDRGVDNDSDPNENDGKYYEISIGNDPVGNNAPTVNAGNDQTVLLTDGAVLNGSAGDDGMPDPPGQLTTDWSQTSGPGAVAFGDSSEPITTANFPGAGTYGLRLSADDGELTASDDVEIEVLGGGPGSGTVDRRVLTSDDDGEERGGGSITLTSSDLELVATGGVNQIVGMRFTGLALPQGATILAAHVQFQTDEVKTGGTSLSIVAHDVDDAPPLVDESFNISARPTTGASVAWVPPPWTTKGEQGFGQQTPNIAAVIQEVVDRPGWSLGNDLVVIITGTGVRTAEAFDGEPDGAPLLHVQYDDGGVPVNEPPVVDAGPGSSISLPSAANLAGSVTDDDPGSVTTTWSKQSGPGSVTFGDAGAVATTAGFTLDGSYVLRLTANDGEFTVFDQLTVNVSPQAANQPPQVNAGPDKSVILPGVASLDGSVTDDDPGSVTLGWSQVSGPGTTSFDSPSTEDTTASFSSAGLYVLRLTADDGEFAAFDEVVVNVSPAGSITTIQRRVASDTDDAEEKANGSVKLNSSDLELTKDGSNQTIGMRFTGIDVPPGATIVAARVQFKVDERNSKLTNLLIQGQASANAPTFTSASGNVSARPRTTAGVAWQPVPWLVLAESGPDQLTPDLAAVIQEIIDQPGWSSGNALVLIVTGTGERVAESFRGDQQGAPLLIVDYQ